MSTKTAERDGRLRARWRSGRSALTGLAAYALAIPLVLAAFGVVLTAGRMGRAHAYALMFVGCAGVALFDTWSTSGERMRRLRRRVRRLVPRLSPRRAPTRCPYCHGDLLPDEPSTACDACGVSYHATCHEAGLLGGCATLACGRQARRSAARRDKGA